MTNYPQQVNNWLDDELTPAIGGAAFEKTNPTDGTVLGKVARSQKDDAEKAVTLACEKFGQWSATSTIARSDILRKATLIMQERKEEIAAIVALETGKSKKDALGEVGAAIEMGFFVAGEGRRYYGRTTNSAVPNRTAEIRRQPVGVCALIIPANTPIANVAWKVFPAILCGDTVVLKPSEDTPLTAIWVAGVMKEAGLPAGVLSVVHGFGQEVGAALVEDERVDLVSFTGSVPVGRYIQSAAGKRLAKTCLELGGKNALVVCDDADLDAAVNDAVLSAFSNAGQRCAAGSRLVVFESVYGEFKRRLIERTGLLKLGPEDTDDLGPVINEKQLTGMLAAVEKAKAQGGKMLIGGQRVSDAVHEKGYYMAPTVIEDAPADSDILRKEVFGPITCLLKVKDLEEAIRTVNDSDFGLTAAIHTSNIHRAQIFKDQVRVGVVSVNGPTYGSEPHMPFGGLGDSGTGFREAGTEALDVYSEWKTIYVKHNPSLA